MAIPITHSTANSIYLNIPSTSVTTPSSGYTINTGTGINGSWAQAPMTVDKAGKIELKGDDADVVINGKSLTEAITKIEQRLAILKPDTRLEKDWEELKKLGDAYRALEQEIHEKMKTWDILKRED